MNLFSDWKIRSLFWGTYLLTILSLWWHTYQIFLINDPPLIAGASAAAIDGMLALTLYVVGRSYGNVQNMAIFGTIIFAMLSGGAQIVSRNLANPAAPWVQDIALYLLPISGVLTLLVLGFIKYFDQNKDGIPDFVQRSQKRPPQRPAPPSFPGEPSVLDRGHSNGHSKQIREFTSEQPPVGDLDDPKASSRLGRL